ncbi:MAG: hypothetical protein ABIE42_06700 [Candidatus Eisenbacteria bacterium]
MDSGRYDGSVTAELSKLAEDPEFQFLVPLECGLMVGLASLKGTGGGAARDWLVGEWGFRYYSLTDDLRREALRCGWPLDRWSLMELGDSLRADAGRRVLAQRTLNRIRRDVVECGLPADRLLIGGIRNPGEAEVFEPLGCFRLMGLRATAEIRYSNLIAEGHVDFAKMTPEEFERHHKRELGVGEPPHGHRVQDCFDIAESHGMLAPEEKMEIPDRKTWLTDVVNTALRSLGRDL